VPGEYLLITGGGKPAAISEVERIDTRREFAVVHYSPMLSSRRSHAALYHTPHLYILGGGNGSSWLRECERYVCAENRWEALPPLPRACCSTIGVVLESSLYALGGIWWWVILRLGAEAKLGKSYLGAQAVQAPPCRVWYPLFQGERD
jgi:hypothetical protein